MKDDGTFELGEKLSAEDHGLLRSYWDVNGLRRNAVNVGIAPEVAQRAEFWSYEEYEERLANAEREAQEAAKNAPEATNPNPVPGGGDNPVPASVSGQQASGQGLAAFSPFQQDAQAEQGSPTPGNSDGSTRAFADGSLAGKSYEDWTKAQLSAEVAKRNELRDGAPDYADEEPMSTEGTKAELAARLTEDDEADEIDEEPTPASEADQQ